MKYAMCQMLAFLENLKFSSLLSIQDLNIQRPTSKYTIVKWLNLLMMRNFWSIICMQVWLDLLLTSL